MHFLLTFISFSDIIKLNTRPGLTEKVTDMKNIKRILFFAISLMLIFSLFSCMDNNDAVIDDDNKRVPVYEGMTVSSNLEVVENKELNIRKPRLEKNLSIVKNLGNFKDVVVESSDYYADLGEEIFITVHINNPDNFEILSFTLNGEKYSSYMFERGSNMENIVIKCNVGRESGEHNYTIDAIKYVDKSAIKDVVIRGNQTIKIVVSEYEHEANCKHDNVEKITVLEAKAATCEQEGLTEGKKCGLCNTVFVEQENLPKLDCTPGDWIIDKEVTPTRDGLKHTECTMCGKLIKEEIIYAKRSQGLDYSINADGISCTVTGIGSCTDRILIIPEYIEGCKVTAIGENAFKECEFQKVVISQYVTEIGARAFMNCKSMDEVTLPAELKVIGEEGFYICNALKNVYYQGDVEGWCSIDFVTGWSSPTGHYSNLYFKDKLVTDLVIPDTVTKIDNHAFFGCEAITSVKIGNGVIEIGDQAFSCCKSLSKVTLGNSVKTIGDCAFESTLITEIVIPDSIEYIGCEAFYYCTFLKNVEIGKSISYVHVGAFLESPLIEYNEYENALYLGNKDNPYQVLISVIDTSISSFKVHADTTAIIGGAFNYCGSLESITLPNGITNIGWHLFQGCSSLANVVIPNSVTNIDECAFYGCASLTSIVIPNGVTNIGQSAFNGCASLESIHIPASVISIGSYAFGDCTSLKNITVDENNEYYMAIDGSLYTKDGKTLIRCVLGEESSTFIIPDGVVNISGNAFSGCTTLVNVVIPDSVSSIGLSAFYGCTSLKSIVIPNGVTRIESFAFYNCTSLESVIIPNSVTFIGDRAFSGCTSLTKIVIPKSVETIAGWAFRDCSLLTIYCEAKSKPAGWNTQWNYSKNTVVWGYKGQ